jgi:hypothetical protein
MGDTVAEMPSPYITGIVDEQVDDLGQLSQLPTKPKTYAGEATFTEAHKLHKQALTQAADLFEILRQIYDRKAYLHLGCSSFDDYMLRLKKEADYLQIEKRTFYRKLAHAEVRQVLHDADMDARGLTQQQAALLNKLPPGMIPEVVEEVRKKAAEYEPRGAAAQFHHPGKVLTNFVEKAVEERLQRFKQEVPDPFEGPNDPPEQEEEERPDFFTEAAKRPIGEKPLPPAIVPDTPRENDERELIDVTDIEFHRGADFIFVGVRVAPGEEYRALLPVGKILPLPLWENGK